MYMSALRTSVSLPSAVRALLRYYFCTPRLFKDAWTLLNVAFVHGSLFLNERVFGSMFLY